MVVHLPGPAIGGLLAHPGDPTRDRPGWSVGRVTRSHGPGRRAATRSEPDTGSGSGFGLGGMSPSLPRVRCLEPRCANVVGYGSTRCTAHGGSAKKDEGPRSRGYTRSWQLRAKAFVAAHPVCVYCGGPANTADHVTPRRLLIARGITDPDQDRYLQSCCSRCHGRKTQEELGIRDER
jgi:5-methylcytosine-specific restriction endonuclease McrA